MDTIAVAAGWALAEALAGWWLAHAHVIVRIFHRVHYNRATDSLLSAAVTARHSPGTYQTLGIKISDIQILAHFLCDWMESSLVDLSRHIITAHFEKFKFANSHYQTTETKDEMAKPNRYILVPRDTLHLRVLKKISIRHSLGSVKYSNLRLGMWTQMGWAQPKTLVVASKCNSHIKLH